MAHLLLWLIARLVPPSTRGRWLEEWQAELRHGRWPMLAGAVPDALAVRRLHDRERGSGRGPWLTDTKQTLRSLIRAPWHVATVTVCLGIGVAVTVTVFSILATILAGDMPGVRDRSSLMRLYLTSDRQAGIRRGVDPASLDEFDVLRQGTASMPQVAAEGGWHFAVRTASGSSLVRGAFVSGNYFDVLGTSPALGRLLLPSDERADAPLAVVLSHAYWWTQFGATREVIGSTIVIGGRDAVIVGVAPQYFSGTDVGDLGEPPGLRYRIYVPLVHAMTLARVVNPRQLAWLKVIGRAADEHDRGKLAAAFEPLARRIESENPIERKNAGVLVQPEVMGPSDTAGVVAIIVVLMMAAPVTVLAIACANVANLQLVRATLRARELAVRSSLGASRGQLVRLLSVESAALAIGAVAAGAFGTLLLLRIVGRVIPFHVTIDWPVAAFVVVVVAFVILVTGVIPGWLATKPGESLMLTGGQRSTSRAISRLRSGLVVAQVALSLLLLLTAALFTRSLTFLAGRVPAAAHESVIAEIRFDTLGYEARRREAFARDLESRLASDPRVEAVGFSSIAPFRRGGRRLWLPGDREDIIRDTAAAEVSHGWFRAAGLTTLRGRTYSSEEVRLGGVAVVDEAFVRRHRLAEPVVGTVLRVDSIPTVRSITQQVDESARQVQAVTIIGVVSNALTRPLLPTAAPTLYLPLRAIPDYASLSVRTTEPAAMHDRIRQVMAAIDPNLPAVSIASLADRFDEDAGDVRLLASAASGLGMSALALALAGVYSVVAFFVSLRTHEFGIRLAIGARPADIVRMVILQASRLVGIGSIAGLVIGVPVLIALGAAFPYTSAFDPIGLLAPVFALVAAAIVAALAPARRAARVDPCSALRSE